MKRFLFLPILLLIATVLVSPAATQAVDEGVVPDVDAVFAEYNRTDGPGCALGIYRHGQIAYAKGYGMADLEAGVPITLRTVFDLASTSKQFTAASLILLEQQGKLSLDDDVRDYIPELPDYGHTISLRQLLNHTSGLRDYIGLMQISGSHIHDVTTGDDALDFIIRQRALNFEPGAEYLYSNSGYLLASYVVERVSGQSLRAFAREHIFEALGMRHTTYIDDHTEVVPHRATGYSGSAARGYRRNVSNWEQNGDGAVFSTVEDLLRWERNFFEPVVGGHELVAELTRQSTLANGDTLAYGQGLILGEHRGFTTVSHGGSWGGYRAQFLRVPEERTAVSVLCNIGAANPTGLAHNVLDVLFGLEEEDPMPAEDSEPVVIAAEEMERVVGHYRVSDNGYRQIVHEEGQLYYERGTSRTKLHPLGEGRFWLEGSPADRVLVVKSTEDGRAVTLEWREADEVTSILEAYEPWTPSTEEMALLAGAYHSEEVQTGYTLVVENDMLVAEHPTHGTITLLPRETDIFEGDQWVLSHVRFARDGAGRVTGFLVSIGRTRDLLFERTD